MILQNVPDTEKLSDLASSVANHLTNNFPLLFPHVLNKKAIVLGFLGKKFRPEHYLKRLTELKIVDGALLFIFLDQMVDHNDDGHDFKFTRHNITLESAEQGVSVQSTRLANAAAHDLHHVINEHLEQVHMDSIHHDHDNLTRLEFMLEHKNYTELRLRLHGNASNEYRFQFQKIFQFIPSDPLFGYQINDTITNTVSLNSSDGDVVYAPPTCANNSDGLLTCILVASDPVTQAVIFQFSFQMAPRQFLHGRNSVPPNRGKFSLVINEPQIAANEMTAVVVRMRIPIELSSRKNGDTVLFGGSASLDWDATFTDDQGMAQPVITHPTLLIDNQGLDDNQIVPVDKKDLSLVFTFAKLGCTSILWDPSLGTPCDPDSSAATLSPGAIVGVAVGGAAFIVALLVAIFIVKKSKTNQRNGPSTSNNPPTKEKIAVGEEEQLKTFPTLSTGKAMLASVNFAPGTQVAPPPYTEHAADGNVSLNRYAATPTAWWTQQL